MDKVLTEFTNFLRSIPDTARYITIGICIIVICFGIVTFLNQNTNKKSIKWVAFAFSIIALIALILICIYR